VDDFSENREKRGFFERNKFVSFAIIVSCMLFFVVFFIQKSKVLIELIPVMRGEVSLDNGFSITTVRKQYPILIKKDDPVVGSRLRFSGEIQSLFSEISFFLSPNNGIIVEVGSHFGYNVINIAKKLKEPSKYYAFEPNSEVFSCLRKSVVLNDLDKVVFLRNIAISDTENVIPIEDCLSLIKDQSETRVKPRAIVANCSTLDKELENEPRPVSLLMIDIPGSEFSILKGASKIVENSQNIKIVMSFDRENSSKSADLKFELQKLKNFGFSFYLVKNPEKIVQADIDTVLSESEVVLLVTRDKLNLNC
jgi:FkbM family methyltransferase